MIKKRTTKTGSRYDVRLRAPDGTERSRTFRTRGDARRYEDQERASQARGTWVDPRAATTSFADVAASWIDSNPAKRPGTLDRDRSVLNRHLLKAFGPTHVGTITPRDVQQLANGWARRYKPTTVRRNYAVLRAIFAYAEAHDLIGRSPCRAINLPTVQGEARPVVTPDDLARLAEAVGPDLAPMVYVGAILGLRWGEVAGLQVRDIDFLRSSTVTISRQRTRGEHGRHVEHAPKSAAGRRTLAAPEGLLDILTEHMARRGLTGADSTAYLFVTPTGEPLSYNTWRTRVWLPAVKAAGLDAIAVPGGDTPKQLGFHDLRRTSVTAMLHNGVDTRTAMGRAGHSDMRLTVGTYAQFTGDADRAAADALGAWFLDGARDIRGMNDSTG